MTKIDAMVEQLKDDGHDDREIAAFLCDGEALAACGFTDDDQDVIETAYAALEV